MCPSHYVYCDNEDLCMGTGFEVLIGEECCMFPVNSASWEQIQELVPRPIPLTSRDGTDDIHQINR